MGSVHKVSIMVQIAGVLVASANIGDFWVCAFC